MRGLSRLTNQVNSLTRQLNRSGGSAGRAAMSTGSRRAASRSGARSSGS